MAIKRGAFLTGVAAAAATARASAQLHQLNPLNPAQVARQLTICVNVPLSGPLGQFGAQVVQGAKAAVDETNLLNALGSVVYAIRPLDDQNSEAISNGNIDVAAADQTVIGIVGNLTADVTIASLTQYANETFAVVVPAVHADALTLRGYHNIYRLPTRDDVAGRLFAATIFHAQPSSFALAVTLDAAYGPDVARGFVQQAKANHRSVDLVTLPASGFDPAAAARTIVERSPDYLFLCGTTAQMGTLVAALAVAGYNGLYGLSDGFFETDTITQYGAQLKGAIVFSPLPPLDRIPSIFQQLTDLKREVSSISALVAYGYAAAQILIQASQRTSAYTRYALLSSMQMQGSFTTLVGPYTFDPFGDPLIPNLYFFKVSGTSFDYVEPAVRNGFIV
jgi:branched-chain amino acid transport system substrate-binding protein